MKALDIKKLFQWYKKNKSLKYGLPLITFCICGSFGLRQFTELRYKYRSVVPFRDKVAEQGIEMKDSKEVTLEAEYEKIKEYNLDNWENKRIDRPWEK